MVTTTASKDELVAKLTRQVTHLTDPPYAELKTALESLIDRIQDSGESDETIDWPVIIAEAVNLRPSHS